MFVVVAGRFFCAHELPVHVVPTCLEVILNGLALADLDQNLDRRRFKSRRVPRGWRCGPGAWLAHVVGLAVSDR